MNIAEEETKKRLDLVREIGNFISIQKLPILSSRVGGSLSFAQNYAIKPTSDIDLDVFLSFKDISDVNPLLQFLSAERTFDSTENWDDFDLIASNGTYKNVAINLWLFNTDTFESIARLEKEYIVYFTMHKPSSFKDYNIFGGGECTLDREVVEYRDGYKSNRYILFNDNVISENYILNNMFFVFPIWGREYSDKIVNEMWGAFLRKYPEVREEQFFDFIISNVTERFSPEFSIKIREDIKKRLANKE